ncbi:hypothetical protein LTS16_020638 [Friedmanniomyces endolithicus]|nr:hypothetical protein LTS16_020638 [Friedmanniomyces endolithicus]
MSIKDVYKQAKPSWLGKKIEPKMLPHYLYLVPIREDVSLLHSMPEWKLKQKMKELTKSLVAIQGIPLDVVETSFADVERWKNDNRASFMSASTSSSAHSTFSLPHSSKRGSLASLFTQYSGDAQVQELIRFNCPTCYTSFSRPNDLLEHLRGRCEKADVARYICHNCQHEAESTIDMDRHCINAKTLDPQHNLGSVEVHVQVKFGFGYPYCCHYFPTTDHPTYDECLVAYHAHIFGKAIISRRTHPPHYPLTDPHDVSRLAASVQAGAENLALSLFDFELYENQREAQIHDGDSQSSYLAPPTSAIVPDHKRKRSLSDTAWLSQHLNPIAAARHGNCDKPLPLLPTLYEEQMSQVHNEAPFMSNAGWAHNGSIYTTNEEVPTTTSPAAFPPYWPPATYPS